MARLGPYELLRQVGTGGMGQVWLGRRSMVAGATKTFAIKLLAPRHVASERHREMFLEEARLSMSLDHSNIVKVHEVGEFEGAWYMAMEWLDGLTLAQLNTMLREREQPLPAGVVGYIVGQILRALAYAHEADHRGTKQPIVHRDVSPQNVMLTVTGDVKLLDFGIARFVSDESSGLYVKGKPRYMAPEQFHGLSREPSIDLFAAGALLHELLDGGRVFRWQAGDKQLLEYVASGRVPELGRAGLECPAELDQLRRGLLALEPDRLPSARAALNKLASWSGYRDASLDLQDLVRALVPDLPDAGPATAPSVVGPFAATMALPSRPLASLSAGSTEPSLSPDSGASDESIQSILARLADDDDDETQVHLGAGRSRPKPALGAALEPKPPPRPPPPAVMPERALEIDWIAAGQPKTGPNLVVPPQTRSSFRVLVVLGSIILILTLVAFAATQVAR